MLPLYYYESEAQVTTPKVTNMFPVLLCNMVKLVLLCNMVILILSYKHGISLHVPQPMNVANTHIHSLLCDDIGFQLFALVVQAKSIGKRSHGYVAKAELHRTGNMCTAAVRFIPEGMHKCMDFDFQKY